LARIGTLSTHLSAAAELGSAVRGLYGEGTLGTGELIQVSNRRAYGLSTSDILAQVEASARYLREREQEARKTVCHTPAGRRKLEAEAQAAISWVFRGDPDPAELLSIVSLIRLASAEGILPIAVAQTTEWISLAGVSAAEATGNRPESERFEAIRRSAALRQRLREALPAFGTFPG